MKGTILLYLYLFAILNTGSSQLKYIDKPFPFDYTIAINGQRSSLKQYYGQPFIVELFTSGCIVCFNLLPKVNELHEKYKGKIRFLLVGSDSRNLPRTYARFQEKLHLTLDAGFDSVLFYKFDPPFVPHYLWVDAKGIIRGVTGPDALTNANLDAFIKGNSENVREDKKQFNDQVLLQAPESKNTGEAFLYRSLLTGPIDSLNPYYPRHLSFSSAGPFFQVINCRIEVLYRYAFFNTGYWNYGDSLYGKVSPEPIFEGGVMADTRSAPDTEFCYSVSFSEKRSPGILQKVLRSDLENNFGYHAKIETRKMPYWALVRADPSNDRLRSRASKTKEQFSYSGFVYEKVPVSKLIRMLDYYCKGPIPYQDETGINYPVDISIEAIVTDLAEVRLGLAKAGLLLIKKEKPMEVLILNPLFKNVTAK